VTLIRDRRGENKRAQRFFEQKDAKATKVFLFSVYGERTPEINGYDAAQSPTIKPLHSVNDPNIAAISHLRYDSMQLDCQET
jgi:hypothetical protein